MNLTQSAMFDYDWHNVGYFVGGGKLLLVHVNDTLFVTKLFHILYII